MISKTLIATGIFMSSLFSQDALSVRMRYANTPGDARNISETTNCCKFCHDRGQKPATESGKKLIERETRTACSPMQEGNPPEYVCYCVSVPDEE